MITTLADILSELVRVESEKLSQSDIKHPTMIGDMYEGLTHKLLKCAIPRGLELQVVAGLVIDGQGNASGQIDCMLVRGIGIPVPYSPGIYQWHVKDVIAVFEVKKSLGAADLSDAFQHLRGVLDIYRSWYKTLGSEYELNLTPSFRSYAETMGEVAPPLSSEVDNTIDKRMILKAIVVDQLAPLRIILGYEGYSTERGLRQGFLNTLSKIQNSVGSGPENFPSLIISKSASLVKMSGHPYSFQRQKNGRWPIMGSSHLNPLLFVLELIWTKLSYDYPMAKFFGEDLSTEALTRLLDAKPTPLPSSPLDWGWGTYGYVVETKQLAAAPTITDWTPFELDETQYIIVNQMCYNDIDINDRAFQSFIANRGINIEAFIDKLVGTTLVARNGHKLTLTTVKCVCAILPDGRLVAAENNTGRFDRWTMREMEKHRSRKPNV